MYLHLNCVLWIIWNGTDFDIENVLTLNYFLNRTVLTFNCVYTKSILILNWIGCIRTVWLKWIVWNGNVFNN